MKKQFILTFVGMMTLLPQQIYATDWVKTGESKTHIHYIDTNSIKIHQFGNGGHYLTTWVKQDFKQAQILSDNKEFWQAKTFYYFDCVNQKMHFDTLIRYDKQGNVLHHHHFKRPVPTDSSIQWKRIVPDSAGATMLHYVCLPTHQIKMNS